MSDKKKKICFVASGGGHLRQLLQLSPLHADFDYYFVTEQTSLGESVAKDHRTLFVPHFAFGQRKTEGFLKFAISGIKNYFASTWFFIKERPDIIISSGAGAAFFTLFWGKLFRKKIIYLESIARVTEISLFGKLAARFADLSIVQWPSMVDKLKGAKYCSPFLIKDAEDGNREGVLVTVGTVMPFDRMVDGVCKLKNEGKISSEVAAQIGESEKDFQGIESFPSCEFEELNDRMAKADISICHGGSGSILGSLKAGCRVIAMARKQEFGEHYDDHQLDITKAFLDMDLIEVAKDENDIERAIKDISEKPRKIVEIDPSDYIKVIREHI